MAVRMMQAVNGYHGTGHDVVLVPDRLGNDNAAYWFNGYSSFIDVKSPIDFTNNFTVSLWIFLQSINFFGVSLLTQGGVRTCNNGWSLGIQGSSDPSFQQGRLFFEGNNCTMNSHQSVNAILLNTWQQVVLTYDRNTEISKIYFDCQLDSMNSIPPLPISPYNLIIGGGNFNNNYYYQGSMDDIRIYDRVLSDTEIQQFCQTTPPQLPVESPPQNNDCGIETATLNFTQLKEFYNVGEKIVVDLYEQISACTRFHRVDLWVAVETPSGQLFFKTPYLFTPFEPSPQPFKTSLETSNAMYRILDFEILPGMGGNYSFYALFTQESKNPMIDGFIVQRSNIAITSTTLANE